MDVNVAPEAAARVVRAAGTFAVLMCTPAVPVQLVERRIIPSDTDSFITGNNTPHLVFFSKRHRALQ